MENKASYTAVGALVLIFILAINIFIVWMTRATLEAQTPYDIYFTGSVTGLQVGSLVRYRGVPVGAVKKIKIDSHNVEQVLVTIQIQSDILIKEDAYASLETIGITGITYVQIHGGSQTSPPLHFKGGVHPVITSRTSRLEEVVNTVPTVLNHASALIQDIRTLLSDANREAMAKTLKNIEILTQSLVSTDKDSPLSLTVDQLKESLSAMRKVSVSIGELFENNRTGLTRFLSQATQTLDTFDRIGRSLENSPTRFFTNDPQQGVRVP